MKKNIRTLLLFCTFCLPLSMFSQVGIGSEVVKSDALLDIESESKGILLPQISLSNLNTLSPITSNTGIGTESLLVYNTNNLTGKGFYYWNGTDRWIEIGKENVGLQYYSYDITPTASPDLFTLVQNRKISKSGHYLGELNVSNAQFPTSELKPGTDNDGFAIKLVGYYTVKNAGTFNFTLSSNDGARIYIDGALVISKWIDSLSTASGSIKLNPGKHKIEFWYYENTGDQSFRFQWGANPDGLPIGTMTAKQFTID